MKTEKRKEDGEEVDGKKHIFIRCLGKKKRRTIYFCKLKKHCIILQYYISKLTLTLITPRVQRIAANIFITFHGILKVVSA